ncbi:MAG: hypothetical protein NC318_03935 [Blautia sp.]|nr:hypothetical protein [Lachnoclostridium sp.]MCM1210732.1 hypothetical protein [Blautia sp.]
MNKENGNYHEKENLQKEVLFEDFLFLAKEAAQNETNEVNLDGANPHHTQILKAMYAGMGQEKFPCVYEAFQNWKADREDLRYREFGEDGWELGLFPERICVDESGLHFTAVASSPKYNSQMTLQTVLLSAGADGTPEDICKVCQPSICFAPLRRLSAGVGAEWKEIRKNGSSEILQALLIYAGVDEEGLFQSKAFLCGLGQTNSFSGEYLNEIQVKDPVFQRKTEHKDDDPYIISYGRANPSHPDDYDYVEETFDKQDMTFPCSGEAVFKNSKDTYGGICSGTVATSIFQLELETGGVVRCGCSSFDEYVSSKVFEETCGFAWDFKKMPWGNRNPFKRQMDLTADLRLMLAYYVNGKSDSPRYMTVCSCEPGDNDKDYQKINKIQLYWGCLEEHTEILMADGSRKQIRDIREGECVRGLENIWCVTDALTGEEKILYRLDFAERPGGEIRRMVKCSAEHPFLTEKGAVSAKEMEVGVSVTDCEGVRLYLVEKQIEDIHGSKVCNLKLTGMDGGRPAEEKAVFYANGIAVGDNCMQGYVLRMERQRREERHKLSNRWRTDYESAQVVLNLRQEGGVVWEQD